MASIGSDDRVKIPPDGILLAPTTENFSIIMEIKHVHTSNQNPPSISSGLRGTQNYEPLKLRFLHTGRGADNLHPEHLGPGRGRVVHHHPDHPQDQRHQQQPTCL